LAQQLISAALLRVWPGQLFRVGSWLRQQVMQTGAYLSVSFNVVDSAQYLAALLAQAEKGKERTDAEKPNLGQITISYGGHTSVITLNKPPQTYSNGPTVQLTSAGKPFISGPLAALRVRDVEGTCDLANWNALQAWYEAIVIATPPAGTWFPTAAPTVIRSS